MYPFGKPFFSNLTHYVRTGDFVAWLIQNARSMDELAFAIGALSHYLGDSIGHSQAINPATAIEFPSLRKKFGSSVTYGESPHGHIRTEFAPLISMDLTDAAFAPPAYHRLLGSRCRGNSSSSLRPHIWIRCPWYLAEPTPHFEVTVLLCAPLSRRLPKRKLCCIDINSLLTLTTRLITRSPHGSLVPITREDGNTLIAAPALRHIYWQFWC